MTMTPYHLRIALVVLLFSLGVVSVQAAQVAERSSIEEKLARIDTGRTVVSLGLVGQYARILDSLEAKCTESRKKLADMAVRGTELVGVADLTAMDFLVGTDVATEGQRSVKCSSTMAAVAVLIESKLR